MLGFRRWPSRPRLKHGADHTLNSDAPRRPRLLLAISIAARHLGQGWAKAVHSGWRLLPRRPRAVLLRLLTGRLPVVAALGLHATGQRDRARAQLRRGHRGRAVEAATACGELELARELV
uniref:hypothetical protein n=1 Tax=Desertihabitans aurantiacus TaxID=2282477 RepID=UPI001300AE06